MAKKKKSEFQEGDNPFHESNNLSEVEPAQLTSEMIEEEKPMEEVSETSESEYEKHPKFAKFKGEKK